MRRPLLRYLGYVMLLTIWSTLFFILPDFLDNPVHDFAGFMTICSYLIALGGMQFLLLWMVGLNRWVNAIILPVYGVLGSVVAYFRVAFHTTITPMVLDATFHTNSGTISGLITWPLVGYIVLNIVLSVGFVMLRWKMKTPRKAWILCLAALLLATGYYRFNDRLHRSIDQRYPFNVFVNIDDYIRLEQERNVPRLMSPWVADSTYLSSDDSLVIVLVVGEAVRYDHLGLNGYTRNTTPRLAQRTNVLSLGDVHSDQTYTTTSVPHILTPATTSHPDWANTKEGIPAYFRAAGWHTAWISNQDMGRTYAHFIQTCDTVIFPNSGKTVFVFDRWVDGDLLEPLSREIQRGAHSLCVLHMIGCHWYYANHVPEGFCPFSPTTANRNVRDNSPEQVVNAYDNCVAYLDVVLDSICGMLRDRPAVVIYQSDHGESLGEDGNWLHAAGAEETKHPGGIIWYSDAFEKKYPEKVRMLRQLPHQSLSTDYVFPTVLSLGGIHLQ